MRGGQLTDFVGEGEKTRLAKDRNFSKGCVHFFSGQYAELMCLTLV